MDTKEIMDDVVKWFKNPKTIKGLAMYLVVTIFLALDFAYWAGAIEVETFGVEEPVDVIIDEPEDENYTLVEQIILDETGAAGRGSPAGNSVGHVGFDVGENVKVLMVNLTSDNPREVPRASDYDLNVYYPDGSNAGSSGGPDYKEQVVVDYTKKGNKTLKTGTYDVEIVYWLNTIGTNWHVTVTVWTMEECGPEGCPVE